MVFPLLQTLKPLGRALKAGVTYLLRDEFTTQQAAPLTSPRTCEPGPGSLTVTNQNYISGGELYVERDDYFLQVGAITRATGLAFKYSVISTNLCRTGSNGVGLGSSVIANFEGVIYAAVGALVSVAGMTANGIGLMVFRSSGMFYIWAGKVIWVDNLGTHNLQAAGMRFGASGYNRYDYLRIAQLSNPWNTDYGIATNRVASPANPQTTTSEADSLVEFTWTPAAGETLELDIRRTDDNNQWIVRCSQAGSTIKLIECNAGVETERSSAAQTWSAGSAQRIVIVVDTQTIRTYVANVAKNNYTSASFNQAATGVKVSGFATGTNLVAWPRVLSGAALAALEAV